MMQRGAHALLFLMCSPFLVLCEDVFGCQSNPPTRHRASVHSSPAPARVRLQYTVKFEVALTPERRDSFLVTVREAKAPIAARRFKELVNTHFFTGWPPRAAPHPNPTPNPKPKPKPKPTPKPTPKPKPKPKPKQVPVLPRAPWLPRAVRAERQRHAPARVGPQGAHPEPSGTLTLVGPSS